MKNYILLFALILITFNLASAKVDLKTGLDTNNILIGEHITVSFTVTAPKKAGIVFKNPVGDRGIMSFVNI